MSEKKRLFIGVKVDFNNRTEKFFSSIPGILGEAEIKLTKPENMHVTLKFLGDVRPDKITQISSKLKLISDKFSEFEPLLKGVGVFKDFYHPKILWFGLRNCPSFEKLKNEIENSLSDLGFEIDFRNFAPHLTVGRFKEPGPVEQLRKFVNMNREVYLQTVPVRELALFESILKPEGPEYTILQKFQLGIDSGFRELTL